MSKLAVLILSLAASATAFSGTPYYCTSAAGSWIDGSNIWALSITQDVGVLGGSANYDCGTCSPIGRCYYTISGNISPWSATSLNTFNITLTPNSGNPKYGCTPTSTVHFHIPLGTVGCAQMVSSDDGHSVLNENNCPVPGGGSGAGEGPSYFVGWNTPTYPGVAKFKAGPLFTGLNGSTYNWSGRTVTEKLQFNNQTCSAGTYEPAPIGPWYLDGNYLGDGQPGNPPDMIGTSDPSGNVIPNRRKAATGGETLPCSYTYDQYMYIDCPTKFGGPQPFEHHQTVFTIGDTWVSATRNNEPSGEQPYGPSEGSFKLPQIIVTRLLLKH